MAELVADPRRWAARQAERRGRLVLALIDGEDAAAHDLGGEGGLVKRKAEHGGVERRDEPGRVK